jgi:superfamily II DNA/RNA helicase
MPRTLILEPTRELAAQVKEQFDKYGSGQKLNVALLIGGVSFGDQDLKLNRGVDVLIATPGRLLDHTERGGLLLTGVELLVIDEADRMLDMGFIPDIERICKLVPFTRQTLFFTATMPPEIRRITETFLHNPVKIEVAKPATAASTITQSQVAVGRDDWQKREVLRTLLREAEDLKNAIIFCNRKREVATLAKSLQKHGFAVGALHGDMEQSARLLALDQFRKGEIPILVASDVAARGLDIPAVSHVFNFDIPHHSDDYVHRIGRTGRAGRTGFAISLVSPSDQKSIAAVEKLIGTTIAKHESAALAAMPAADESTDSAETPRSGRRRSGNREANADAPRGGRRDGRREREPRPDRAARPEREPRAHASEARAPANESRPPENEAPRERKPRRERDRRPNEDRNGGQQPVAASPASLPPSIGRPQAPRPRREEDFEPGDHSHLPAFLLRPIRARA